MMKMMARIGRLFRSCMLSRNPLSTFQCAFFHRAPNSTRAQSFIPRRGEKDFEPRNTIGTGTGTKLQQHLLDKSRNAMFTALTGARGTNSRSMSHAIWLPGIARAHVIHARGKHFATLGASVSRDGSKKRLELLPEEALYLFERGSLFCWKQSSPDAVYPEELEDDTPAPGQPMSVQQGYAEMLGHENLSLDHYQVYAYLKRLGYNVLRTSSPTPPLVSWWRRCVSALLQPFRAVRNGLALFLEIPIWKRRDWWRPRLYHGWLFPRNYSQLCFTLSLTSPHAPSSDELFSRLQFIPRGHGLPLNSRYTDSKQNKTPYKIFFDVYKPAVTFRRTDEQRPAPSFQVVVIKFVLPVIIEVSLTSRLYLARERRQSRPFTSSRHSLMKPKTGLNHFRGRRSQTLAIKELQLNPRARQMASRHLQLRELRSIHQRPHLRRRYRRTCCYPPLQVHPGGLPCCASSTSRQHQHRRVLANRIHSSSYAMGPKVSSLLSLMLVPSHATGLTGVTLRRGLCYRLRHGDVTLGSFASRGALFGKFYCMRGIVVTDTL